ncbi:uncharacterized protein NDAI_0E04550 [Naumovozyma dairenensis CBS 421]|uniref:Uncharacterized protein n=1 Tax=Naumovozyma dairenensis (strain ATCC 10597 / BCRC 20456 / CBS 421 / NBRC 0211 / NRRL Y-12639) TaxID=1071378 RepID=G0WC02_NAUDC|nr:hypothetical protein NDAI_0E04550 [Naumovozyma dairenensis CBS 421]CCD25272.1 hypothetical protein NDAI_0E04550 [Naumovozyma dairenensis CBS 421]
MQLRCLLTFQISSKNLGLHKFSFGEQVKNEIVQIKQQSNNNKMGSSPDINSKIEEVEKFVPDSIIKRGDSRLLACIKNFSDVNLGNINPDMLISTGSGIDVTQQLLKIQSLLLSKQIAFKDWVFFLNNRCFGIAARAPKDERDRLMDWANCVISLCKHVEFYKNPWK